jgi:hypothetical protein
VLDFISNTLQKAGRMLEITELEASVLWVTYSSDAAKEGLTFSVTWDLTLAGIHTKYVYCCFIYCVLILQFYRGTASFVLTYTAIETWFVQLFTTNLNAAITIYKEEYGLAKRDGASTADSFGAAATTLPLATICTEYQNYTIVNLASYSQGVGATVPACLFANMPYLKTVIIGDNNLTGSLPDFLFTSYNVTSGDLSQSITALANYTGYVEPDSNETASTSDDDYDSSNDTTYITTSQISVLSVTSNLLSGTIPPSFDQLTAMEWLDLSGNSLTGGLDNLLSYNYLEYLDISDNEFTDSSSSMLLGDWILQFPNLQVHNISCLFHIFIYLFNLMYIFNFFYSYLIYVINFFYFFYFFYFILFLFISFLF